MKEKQFQKTQIKKFAFSIIITIMLILLIYQIKAMTQKNPYTYQIEQTVNSQVQFFTNEYLDNMKNQEIYISDITHYIDFTFQYQFSGSKVAQLKANENIYAILSIDYANTNQNLFQKQFAIITNKTIEPNQKSSLSFTENLNIPYQEYRNEVMKFKEQFNLPIKAYITLYFIVDTEVSVPNSIEKQTKQTIREITMDLSQPIFEIIEQTKGEAQNGKIEDSSQQKGQQYYVLSIIVLALLTFIFLFIIEIRKNPDVKKSIHRLELNRLLKKYENIIVEVKQEISIKNKMIIEVKDFNELLDVEEEIRQPILYYEKDSIAVFIIIQDEIVYQWTLTKE